jgi:L-lactate utilization protein LutB
MGILGKNSAASLCVECGKCKEQCPQHIDIPEKMKEVEAQFEKPITKLTAKTMKLILPLFRQVTLLRNRQSSKK